MQTDSFDAYKQMTCNSKASKEPFNQEYLESQLDNPWLYLVMRFEIVMLRNCLLITLTKSLGKALFQICHKM